MSCTCCTCKRCGCTPEDERIARIIDQVYQPLFWNTIRSQMLLDFAGRMCPAHARPEEIADYFQRWAKEHNLS